MIMRIIEVDQTNPDLQHPKKEMHVENITRLGAEITAEYLTDVFQTARYFVAMPEELWYNVAV